MSIITPDKRRPALRPANDAHIANAPAERVGVLWRSALPLGMLGTVLLFVAFPPIGAWPLAWLAPVPWLMLVRVERLPGRKPYAMIWLASFAYWLAMLQGIRLAHPALYAGWLALAWYVAFYLPIFVALARVAVHRLRLPLMLAGPVVWVGLELVRSHLLSGFPVALLSHTQTPWPVVLQIADWGGAYAVSFIMVLVSASLAEAIFSRWRVGLVPVPWRAGLIAAVALTATVGYGYYRLNEAVLQAERPGIRVALIQGSLDTVFDATPAEYLARVDRTFYHYGELTRQAREENSQLDLVVWPESMFAAPELTAEEPLVAPADTGLTAEQFRQHLAEMQKPFQNLVREATTALNPPRADGAASSRPTYFLFGSTTYAYAGGSQRTHNSALLADPDGSIAGRYYKMHPVMFGEYIPLADWFPWIYTLTPISGGLTPGDGPQVVEVGGMLLSPSICFESTVPHLIRRQVAELSRGGRAPDVLVNVTNDGWFKGSSLLDLHFRCAIFRAIENRKPIIIAANTGFSASLDGNGRVLKRGPRRKPQVIVADVRADGRSAPYQWLGDLPAVACALACGGLAIVGFRNRRKADSR